MHLARPVAPRLEPIPAVAAKAREAMKSQPINAVNVTATMAHNRTVAKAIGKFAQTVLFEGELRAARWSWRSCAWDGTASPSTSSDSTPCSAAMPVSATARSTSRPAR